MLLPFGKCIFTTLTNAENEGFIIAEMVKKW